MSAKMIILVVTFLGMVSVAAFAATLSVVGAATTTASSTGSIVADPGGVGTAGDPFQISNCVELQRMNVDVQEFYILKNDIDCTFDTQNAAGALFNGGAGFDPIGRGAGQGPTSNTFIGSFDGQGFKIIGLKIDRPSESGIGLFGSVGRSPGPPIQVEIKNVTLENVHITGATHTGSLAGFSRQTIFRDVSSSGSVTGTTYTGGLIAEVYNGLGIFDSSSSASVSGGSEVGGLVGRAWDGSLNHVVRSFATGNVSGTGNQIGGLLGFNKSVDVIESSATGNVSGVNQVGGLIGFATENAGTDNSYAQGDVNGIGDVGGLVGLSQAFHDGWEKSYSSGSVNGSTNVGGFIGAYESGALVANFWDQTKNLNLQDTGSQGDEAGVTAETTANMFTVSTYTAAGWDFSATGPWDPINDGVDYPQFGAEQTDLSDLFLGKSESPLTVLAGDDLTYTVVATNVSTETNLATGVFVTDTLPPRVTFKSATPSQGATRPVTGSTVVWDVGELFGGQSETLEIVATVDPSTPEGTVLTNITVINGDQEDPVPGNNTATAITLVQVTDFQVEPSFDLYQDPLDGAIGLKVDVAQVTSPVTGNGAEVLLGAFHVQLTYDGTCVHILALREMDFPIIAENINNHAGVTSFAGFATEGIAAPLDLGHALTRMIGNVHKNCAVAMRVVDLRDLDGNKVGVAPSTLSVDLLRGDARPDGDVNIADALFIAQHLVGLRPACTLVVDTTCLHSVNAASVRQDGAFDQKTIADALFIAQQLVGLRDEFYNLLP